MSSSSSSRRVPNPTSSATSPPILTQPPIFPQMPFNPQQEEFLLAPQPHQPQASSPPSRKRKAPGAAAMTGSLSSPMAELVGQAGGGEQSEPFASGGAPASAPKKSRTNTPWSPAEEQRLKTMRDAGSSWGEIAKTFPNRTEGSVKKHWYKDMHYADFAEDESAALLAAIKEYEASKWKVIGQKVGKPAKACEQYAKEHFGGRL